MEINLEMPSLPDGKLETALNSGNTNGTNEIHAGENDSSFPRDANTDQSRDGADVNAIESKSANAICYEPQKGLEFESKEAAYSFYREYARSVGFGITIKASRRSKKSGKFIDVKIACSRFGNKRESSAAVNPRSCPKTDCKASMHMKRRQDGKWYIYSVVKEHNHEICPDDFYCAIKGRYKQSGSAAFQKKGLQLALDMEDVKILFNTFSLRQSETPDFYYAVDFDKERRMRNVFWIDAKGRHDYAQFFDVVLFDTSYLKNGYRVPFVPVVGVNHHFHCILLGSALTGDETSSTFVWLMRTWLRAVGGQTPKVVITADDMSLKDAVTNVFPDARHCFSLWHILPEISQNLSPKLDQFADFISKFNQCIYESWTNEEFENRWCRLVDKFQLTDDDWVKSLYENRRKWVPTYMRDTFLGGLCTTKRSESISSFFDKYIDKETTFKEFIDQYESFLHHRCEEEDRAEFETLNIKPFLKSVSPFEKQMSKIYTHAIFKKFQAEVLGTFACNLQREAEDETTVTFRVNDLEEHQNFIVSWTEAKSDITCLCHSFEYRGFLCRHAMIALQVIGISSIPSQYILKRWTRDAKIRDIRSTLLRRPNFRVQRFNDLYKFAIKLGQEGSTSQETYDIALIALEEALKHCVGVNNSIRSVLGRNMLVPQSFLSGEDGNLMSNMAKASKKKRVLKKRKVQQDSEAASLGIQNSRQKMEQLKQRTLALQNSYIPQLDVQAMELDNRTPIIDGYYGAQQDVQGPVQLTSVALLREGYYSNQQAMQGNPNSISTQVNHYTPQHSLQGLLHGQLGFRARPMHGGFDIQDSLQDMESR